MDLFVGSFIIFILTALALGIGILFRGQTMHAGCRKLPDQPRCKFKSLCGGDCRREN